MRRISGWKRIISALYSEEPNAEGSHNGIAAVLKTAGRKAMQVRLLSPPPFSFPQLTATHKAFIIEHEALCLANRLERRRRAVAQRRSSFPGGQPQAQSTRGFESLRHRNSSGPGAPASAPEPKIEGIKDQAFANIHQQARLQVQGREERRNIYELLLPPEPEKGLCSLPAPSPGDIFLDFEGDQFTFEGGLEYLFGVLTLANDNVDLMLGARTSSSATLRAMGAEFQGKS